MKTNLLLALLLIVSLTSYAQVETVVSGLDEPLALASRGDKLYVSINDNRIDEIDLSTDPVTITTIASGLQIFQDLLVVDNYLYIGAFSMSGLLRINLDDTNPQLETFVPGVIVGFGLAERENELFYGEPFEVSRQAITTGDNSLVTGDVTGPTGLAFFNDDLYMAENLESNAGIFRTNVTETNPNTELFIDMNDRPVDLEIINNFLFVSRNTVGEVSLVDVSSNSPELTNISFDFEEPAGLTSIDNDLYIADRTGGIIYRYSSSTLSVSENQLNNVSSIYPNPVSNVINFSNISSAVATIYDIQGRVIKENIDISNFQNIDVSFLKTGTYFIRFENNAEVIKFIKK